MIDARLTRVILVSDGANKYYFSIEGVLLASIIEGKIDIEDTHHR